MRHLKRIFPSPAMAVASLALLVALTGTGVAAIQLAPKNSIASPQVVDGSLQKKDINASVFAGAVGPAGPVGPSDAFSAAKEATIALSSSTPTEVISVRTPTAGKYVVWADAEVRSPGADDAVRCRLLAGTKVIGQAWLVFSGQHMVMAHGAGDLPAGNVTFSCVGSSGKGTARSSRITAIKLGNLTASG